jgi:hypothetical protein
VGHAAGCDAGFSKNSSAIAIARENPDTRKVELAYHHEDEPKPGHPLVPGVVVRGWIEACVEYGVERIHGDLHNRESTREVLATPQPATGYEGGIAYGDFVPTADVMIGFAERVKGLMATRRCWLPNDKNLVRQFKDLKTQPISGGRTRLIWPKDGARHGDVLFAAIIALAKAGETAARAARNSPGVIAPSTLAGGMRGVLTDAVSGGWRDGRRGGRGR